MIRTIAKVVRNTFRTAVMKDVNCSPLFPLYHITPFCNLRCAYCEGFPELDLPRDDAMNCSCQERHSYELSTVDVKRLLGILRREFDFIFLTGGEPLVRDDIEDIITHAGALGFRAICMNTNSILLPARESVLNHISQLVISLDMIRADEYAGVLGCGKSTVEGIISNVERYSRCQAKYGYRLKVHAVILPGKIDYAEEVLEFCLDRNIPICFSPLQVDYRAHDSLQGDPAYTIFVDRLIDLKRRGKRISGSYDYYRNIRNFAAFRCVPMLIPRILPNGRLLYPCRPKGRIAGNILDFGSWGGTVNDAIQRFGAIEPCERSCRIRCYIEPSLLMKNPGSLIREFG
ncbi:MAG: radical SAM protein [Candidatus Eisenbacteria bacterium]